MGELTGDGWLEVEVGLVEEVLLETCWLELVPRPEEAELELLVSGPRLVRVEVADELLGSARLEAEVAVNCPTSWLELLDWLDDPLETMEVGELSNSEVVVTALVTVKVLVTVLMTVTDTEMEVSGIVEELAIMDDVDIDVVGPFWEVTDVVKLGESGCAEVLGDVTDVPASELLGETPTVDENAIAVDIVVSTAGEVGDVGAELCSIEVCSAVLDRAVEELGTTEVCVGVLN